MFFLVYVSAAVTWFSDTELQALLRNCRLHNQQAGITGMLLYKDGNFMQALEGDEPTVRALLQRIAADLRHRGMVTLDSGHTPERQFLGWHMGFANLNTPADGNSLPEGYSAFMDLPLTDACFSQAPGHCWQLLRLFRQLD